MTDDLLWTRRMWLLLAALFCGRVAYLAVVPLELCPDEAYYWDWSRQLDWGYYSKPPMIAWIIAYSTSVGGHSEFVVRLPAAVLGTIGLWPVFALGRSLFGPRVGFWAVLAVAATPGMAALSLLMTIDAPFLCAWAFAVWLAWEAFGSSAPEGAAHGVSGSSSTRRLLSARFFGLVWVALVISTGLGLLSKQTMLSIFPLVLLWLASDRTERRRWRSPAVWTWIAASLMFLAPVVWWNWRHGWITIQHTREHFQSYSMSIGRHFAQSAEFWASQFGVLSPVTCALMVVLGLAALASFPQLDRRARFLVCLSVVPMLGVTALSLVQRVQPNWPAAFHLTGFVLLAAWGCAAWDSAVLSRRLRQWFPMGIAVGSILVVAAYAAPFVLPVSALAGGPLDVTARLRGWRTIGIAVGDELQKFPNPHETVVIAATSRGPVSELAYYLPRQPRVYRWNPTGIVESQHEIWGGPRGPGGSEALLVTQRRQAVPDELADAFETVQSLGAVQVHLGGSRMETLSLWRGTGYRGWPQIGATRFSALPATGLHTKLVDANAHHADD